MLRTTARTTATAAAVVAALTALPSGASEVVDRAMFAWNAADSGLVDVAAGAGAGTVYLHVVPGTARSTQVAARVAEAHAAGLRVHALAGDPTWGSSHEADMLAWVREVRGTGLFDAIVLDVEPYLLPEWNASQADRDGLASDLVSSLRKAGRAAGGLGVHAVVPFWYDDPSLISGKRTLAERIARTSDGVVVMAYRDSATGPNGIVALAAGEVDLARRLGRSAVIAVETGVTGTDHVDFSEEGRAAMEAELAIVVEAFAGSSGFGGVAIHHVDAYRVLPD